MQSNLWRARADRRVFIGGSEARVIMGSDEAALIQLWREKRGEAAPEDLSGNLMSALSSLDWVFISHTVIDARSSAAEPSTNPHHLHRAPRTMPPGVG
jgi:hypothetical protein